MTIMTVIWGCIPSSEMIGSGGGVMGCPYKSVAVVLVEWMSRGDSGGVGGVSSIAEDGAFLYRSDPDEMGE
jgi:hypothetical protein